MAPPSPWNLTGMKLRPTVVIVGILRLVFVVVASVIISAIAFILLIQWMLEVHLHALK
jgi:hypothetical protein